MRLNATFKLKNEVQQQFNTYGLTYVLDFFEVVVVRTKIGKIFAAFVKTRRDAMEKATSCKTDGLTLLLYASVLRPPSRL